MPKWEHAGSKVMKHCDEKTNFHDVGENFKYIPRVYQLCRLMLYKSQRERSHVFISPDMPSIPGFRKKCIGEGKISENQKWVLNKFLFSSYKQSSEPNLSF